MSQSVVPATSTPGEWLRRAFRARATGGEPWNLAILAVSLIILAPFIFTLVLALSGKAPAFGHILSTRLGEHVATSAMVTFGALAFALPAGTVAAWLTTQTRFPGARFFGWALVLPLAVPGYLAAAAWGELLDVAGPVQGLVRGLTGWQAGDYPVFGIRSVPGLAFVLGTSLYPYIYLAARVAFLGHPATLAEAARSLGLGPVAAFWRAGLPAARPAILAGAALLGMECLADYGAASLFGVPTLSVGVFRAWESFGDLTSAARLGMLLALFAALLVTLERIGRAGARFSGSGRSTGRVAVPVRLSPMAAAGAFGLCAALLAFGFGIPVARLVALALAADFQGQVVRALPLLGQSAALGLAATSVTLIFGLMLAACAERFPLARAAGWAASLGYAVPGAVLAVGGLGVITAARALGVGLSLTGAGALLILLWAYCARFTAASFTPFEAAYARLSPHPGEAARSLGAGPGRRFLEVEWPLLIPATLTGGLAVFVDVMKELPATVLLRPFGLETLALRAYGYAKEERLAEAAAPALLLILAGLAPVLLLARRMRRGSPGTGDMS